MKFRYVEPSIEYKEDAINYIKETIDSNSKINGVGKLNKYLDDYEGWLEFRKKSKEDDPTGERVPGGEYFLVNEDKRIIGMANIRYKLNERLSITGGHIGYSIRPSERENGYNKINLYLALKVCKEKGIKKAMLTAAVDNPGSWKTMEALGGELDEVFEDEGILEKRYYIDVDKSLEKYKDIYEKYLY